MSEWIDVEDELPEVGAVVIAYHKDWGVEVTVRLYYNNFLDIGITPGEKASHWMPLPEPPK